MQELQWSYLDYMENEDGERSRWGQRNPEKEARDDAGLKGLQLTQN